MTACSEQNSHRPVVILGDKHKECHYVPKPSKPYTDKKVGKFLLQQNRMIGVCMAVSGSDPQQ